MARIVLGPTVASASGSVGGCVFSRNRYGPYIRQRVNPVNPNTFYQNQVRSLFSVLSTAWNIDLDQAERDAWILYALNTFGANGMTGQNAYIALNSVRMAPSSPFLRLDTAPGVFNLTELGPIGIGTMVPATSAVPVTFSPTDEWNADGGFIFLSYARPTNDSIVFNKGPFLRSGTFLIVGDTAVPATSPFAGVSPFPFVTGQRMWIRAIASAPDGRFSVPQIVSKIVP